MSSMFPTPLAMRIAKDAGIDKLLAQAIQLTEAVRDFQKVSTVSGYEDAVIMLEAHVVNGELDEDQHAALKRIYDFTDIEVDGIIVDRLGGIIREANIEANSLSATQILNQIRNGEDTEATNGNIKKVIFELSKDE